MAVTNSQSHTCIDEIASGIYRISTPVPPSAIPGGFSFNQYLIADDEPLLFHTGPRGMFPLVREAIETVLPVSKLRYIGFSHCENDECGAMPEFLAEAPRAEPLCGNTHAHINRDMWAKVPHPLGDGESLSLGRHKVQWFDTPHLPHSWECGFLLETSTRTFLCGDLFTQGGNKTPALTTSDILGPSEAFRARLDYFSHTPHARTMLDRLAATRPTTLACMHGSAWQGDGARLLGELADALERR